MPHIQFYEDRTDYKTHLENLALRLQKNPNKITKRRHFHSLALTEYLTVENPELIVARNNELIPTIKIPCSKIWHFYITRQNLKYDGFSSYIKVSHYKKDGFMSSGFALDFSVVNMISAVWHTATRFAGCKKLDLDLRDKSIDRNKNSNYANITFDKITFNADNQDGLPERSYFSDIPWEERLKFYHSSFLPYSVLLTLRIGHYPLELKYNPDKKYSSYEDPPVPEDPEDIISREYGVNCYCGDFVADDSWAEKEDNVVSRFADTEFIKFIARGELPILEAITSNSMYRPIKDPELKFLNETYMPLEELFRQHKDPIIFLAYNNMGSFIRELEEKKIVVRCSFCNRFIRYKLGKKYCSLGSEGRDCGKTRHNRQYYGKNKERISAYYREEMRKTRQLMRSIHKQNKDNRAAELPKTKSG